MKRITLALLLMLLTASHAFADKSDIVLPAGFGQEDFEKLSRQFGLATSYKPLAPAEPLGILGFDIGVELSFTDISDDDSFWEEATEDVPGLFSVQRLHVQKGLPFGIDVGATYAVIPYSDITLWGAELKWAMIEGGIAMPAVAVRGTYSKVSGVEGLDFSTKGVDVSISKGIAILTPYAGAGLVLIDSDPSGSKADLDKVSLTETKLFAGIRLSLLAFRITAEYELAEAPTYTLKLSVGL